MTFKNPLRKNKCRNPETVVISTFEDLLKFFDDSTRRAKAKSKVKVDFDDNFVDDSDDVDAGINADDGSDGNDDDESIVRFHDSRSDSANNVS